jgi:hypothetical protein
MNGREFLGSAVRLSSSPHAADLRSAVSRAYYGAFHATLDSFAAAGIYFSQHSTESHVKMPQCLGNCNIPLAQVIAAQLQSLREDRNCADYEMDDHSLQSTASVELRIRVARQVIAGIDALLSDPERANIQTILRVHAKVLGMHVSS